MAARNRASKVRAAAAALSARHGTTFNAMFDRGARWDLDWVDRPTGQAVEKLSKIDIAGAEVRLHRNYSLTATALAVIRAAAGGANVRSLKVDSWSSTDIMCKLDDVEHPERPANDREQHMVTALLAAATPPGHRWANETRILELITSRGLAWLLGQAPITETAASSAIEVLTGRYAQGEAKWRWERQTVPMDARAAVDAALADPEIDQTSALALLERLAQWRTEQHEARAMAAARRADASWSQIGAALGVSETSTAARRHSLMHPCRLALSAAARRGGIDARQTG